MSKKKDTKKETRRSPDEVNALRERMVAVKKRLPRGAVTMFISCNPAFNSYKKSSRVRLVHNLTIVDEEITDLFEKLADLHEQEQAKQTKNSNS